MNLKSFGIIIIVLDMPHSLCEHIIENHNISISTTFWKYIAWSYRVLAQTCGSSKSITKFNFFLIEVNNIDPLPYNLHGLYHARDVYLSIKLISKGVWNSNPYYYHAPNHTCKTHTSWFEQLFQLDHLFQDVLKRWYNGRLKLKHKVLQKPQEIPNLSRSKLLHELQT